MQVCVTPAYITQVLTLRAIFGKLVNKKRMKELTQKQKARFVVRSNILKAVAHPSRLFIVEKLAEKPFCVNELTGMIGSDISTVSKHLSILKNAGIITDRKQGTTVFYSLETPCLLKFLGCLETVIEQNLKRTLATLH